MDMKKAYKFLDEFFKEDLNLSYEVLQNDDKGVKFVTVCLTEGFGDNEVLIEVNLLSNDCVVVKFVLTDVKQNDDLYKRINEFNASNANLLFKCYLDGPYLVFEHAELYCINFDMVGALLETLFDEFAEDYTVNLINNIFKEDIEETLAN